MKNPWKVFFTDCKKINKLLLNDIFRDAGVIATKSDKTQAFKHEYGFSLITQQCASPCPPSDAH